MIYFDNAATSLYKPNSVKLMVEKAVNELTANPGRSGHFLSVKTGEMVFETREAVKQFLHAPNHQVVFTKNCTEALNLALFGLLNAGDNVITSCFEHNSVLRPLERLKNNDVDVTILQCELADFHTNLATQIKPNTKLVVVTGMSNVTGQSPNLYEIGTICKKHNILLLVDGAQSSGHIDIDLENINIDLYAFAGHKGFCAITGVGGLLIKNGVILKPLLCGGTGTESENLLQPNDVPEGLEAGTLPTIPIASLKAGVEFLIANFKAIKEKESALSNYLYKKLSGLDFIELYSTPDSKNVFSFNIRNMDSMLVADILNQQYKICVRAGLHCAPLIHKKLGSLQTGAVRVSVDFSNTFQQVDKLIYALKEIANDR